MPSEAGHDVMPFGTNVSVKGLRNDRQLNDAVGQVQEYLLHLLHLLRAIDLCYKIDLCHKIHQFATVFGATL